MSKRKQLIDSILMGSAVTVMSVTIAQAQPNRQPLVPNPKVTIDGVTATPGVGLATPSMPRAVAPPVGDISVSNINAAAPQIEIGSEARTNLTLKGAPAREALELLARAANLNLAYSDGNNSADSKTATKPEPTVSVNFRNEPIQNAFNYVLQLSGLEANRIGNTVFVGTRLPDSIRETVVRTLRLNQVSSGAAANFLATQGAESQIPVNTVTVTNTGVDLAQSSAGGSGSSGPTGSAISRITETRSSSIQTLKTTTTDGPLILRGLSVSADDRLNSVTLVGSPRKVAMASELLIRLDARRRQVALNVKIVDVTLQNNSSLGATLNLGAGSTSITTNAPNLITFGGITALNPLAGLQNLGSIIQAQITNGNAKILTDPTLVVQEGQRSTVNLTQEVFGGFTTSLAPNSGTTSGATVPIINQTPIIKQAGLILDLLVNRIDDNGYVSVSASPTVSAPGNTISTSSGTITLLKSRTLNSGEIRLRDGQPLILSGIIQESDTTTVSKVPILGDIPLLGALFRSTTTGKQRDEVVVIITPRILDDNQKQSNYYTPGVDSRLLMGK